MIIVLDVDGTLLDHNHRFHYVQKRPKNFPAYFAEMDKDQPFPAAQKALQKILQHPVMLFILTGRPEEYRELTARQLKTHFGLDTVPWNSVLGTPLVMRQEGDYRSAVTYKEDLCKWLAAHPLLRTESRIFVDDDERNAEMFQKYGLFLRAPDVWNVIV